MYKIKILLPVLMILSITGLTMLPLNSETIKENSITIENTIENVPVLNENVNVKLDDMGTMKASWYGPRFHGRLTANGEIYDQMGYTAAHKSLPFGTLLKLTNPKTNKSVVVRINDRGPYIPGRKIDLSKKVAMELGAFTNGVVKLKVERITIVGIDSPIMN
jgi:peptidoglycan lytic transglycosylase